MSAERERAISVETSPRSGHGSGASAIQEQPPGLARERATLLIIDDDQDVREILSHYFTAKGFRVETAESGEGIVDLLERTRPSLLLLDLMLPGEDGKSVLDRLRASGSWRQLPVVMITAAHDPVALEPLKSGTDGWFEKPLDLSALLRHVQRLVSQ